jgi:putative membrane protein
MDFKQLLKTWLLLALGVVIAANVARGIHYDSNGALVIAVLLLSFCNVVLKPLLMLFSLPFILLTFGLGIWLINALLLYFVGSLDFGFRVEDFGSAMLGALIVSITSAAANLLFGTSRVRVQTGARHSQSVNRAPPQNRKSLKDDDDVIDI